MNSTKLFLKRFASFIRSLQPIPPKNSVEDVLNVPAGADITDRFIDLYYATGISTMNWRGNELLKNPCDLWVYCELMQEIKPDYIIETGTHHGASALYYSEMAKLFGLSTKIITIDINPKLAYRPEEHRITPLIGISTKDSIVKEVSNIVKPTNKVIVLLDSDHSKANVLEEMKIYSKFVSLNSYLVVEDSIVNGHPTFPTHGEGPFEAIEAFQKINNDFEIDMSRQKFLLTYNNKGYLKRIK